MELYHGSPAKSIWYFSSQNHSVLRKYDFRAFLWIRFGLGNRTIGVNLVIFHSILEHRYLEHRYKHTIGVNLGIFASILATVDINMPPLRGLVLFLDTPL